MTPMVAAFHQGLQETGYVVGQNVTIEYRWAHAQHDQEPAMTADLVSRQGCQRQVASALHAFTSRSCSAELM